MIHPVEALWCHDCGTLELEAILQSQLMELAGNLLPAVYSDLRQRGILPTFDGSILRFRRRDNNVTVRLHVASSDAPASLTQLTNGDWLGLVDKVGEVIYYTAASPDWGVLPAGELPETLEAAGLKVASGMKFGTRYRVYRTDETHATWLLHLLRDSDTWLDIVRAVRVAHGVRKSLVANDGEHCLALEWVKP
ncbi:MAG: hypothetical protein VX686_01900 [Candidatus Thermoplasmatota archaeon]|nr:hypothetical protein [Candidatus Thermoplasmatota archaeon]